MYGRVTRLLGAAAAGLLLAGGLAAAGLSGAAAAATSPHGDQASGRPHDPAASERRGQPAPGTVSTVIGGPGGPDPATNVSISACTLDYAQGALYFALGGLVDKVSRATGVLSNVAAVSGDACGVTADAAGNLLVAAGDEIEAVAARTGTFYGTAMQAGHVYTIATNFFPAEAATAGGAAVDVQPDRAGNLVVAVGGAAAWRTLGERDSQVVVIAERDGTFYGQQMTKGQPYVIAGTIDGFRPGNGVPATGVDLGDAIGALRIDAAGNVVIATSSAPGFDGSVAGGPAVAPQVRVIADRTGTYYGRHMLAGYIYTIAGGGTKTGNGVPAVTEKLAAASAVAIDRAGNILVAAGTVRVIAAKSGTFYGQAMLAGDIYSLPALSAADTTAIAVDSAGNVLAYSATHLTVSMLAERSGWFYGQRAIAGHDYPIAGNGQYSYSGDGGPATSAELGDPDAVATFGQGDLTAVGDQIGGIVRLVPGRSGVYFGQKMRAGYIYTVAGDGSYRGVLSFTGGLAFDPAGNLIITDAGLNEVLVAANRSGTFYGQPMTAGHVYPLKGVYGLIATDSSGNLLISSGGIGLVFRTEVRVLAAKTGTFYGQQMTAGQTYTVAGDGTWGHTGDGGPATAAEIGVTTIATDASGNLIIAGGNYVRVVAAQTGTFYGQPMTAGYIYTIAGGGTQSVNGAPALQTDLDAWALAVDADGNVLLGAGNEVWMLAEQPGTYYGITMTTGDMYQVAHVGGFLFPDQMAVAPGTGDLLIAEASTVISVTR